jgi:integrase/recombinase XerD
MAIPATKPSWVRMSGPLAPYADLMKRALAEVGYTPLSAAREMRMLANLSDWLESEGLEVSDLNASLVEEFTEARLADGYVSPPSRSVLRRLLEVLREAGVLEVDTPIKPTTPTDVLLQSFRSYLLEERSLAPSTTAAYVGYARRFAEGIAGKRSIGEVTAKDVTNAVLHESRTKSAAATSYFAMGLRSFLRFCFGKGMTPTDLSQAALTATRRRTSTLPRGISRDDVTALLAACDRRRSQHRRDYAILITLIRLGLRASEVAALTIDDIDWREGLLVVHGKSRRDDVLPLPRDVGEAISNYVQRGRPKTERRELFLRFLVPAGPLDRGGVGCVVRRACVRAGLPPIGPHRLRHSLACHMVGAGVPLPEIGQVLRHRHIATTSNYARVDIESLRRLAQPWPGSES